MKWLIGNIAVTLLIESWKLKSEETDWLTETEDKTFFLILFLRTHQTQTKQEKCRAGNFEIEASIDT